MRGIRDRISFTLAHNTWPWIIGFVLIVIVVALLCWSLAALVLMLAWNTVIAIMFGLPEMTFSMAFLLFMGMLVVGSAFRTAVRVEK